ncbi:MAG: ABC transporter permease [Lachnospiraceae bacterium]|nr:ABC transporter permease [Lachnospiraceae bacterium]MCR5338317.1 ABC transporter permease [Lachnospiraceae bacterium]
MKKFISNIKRYKSYMLFSVKSSLKADVATSRLNWLWWILNPLLFMLVYTFVSLVVFGKGEKYFPLFVFIGLNLWNFFSACVNKSVRLVRKNKGTITKVYLPKYILIFNTMMEEGFKMCIAFLLVIVMIPIYHVHLTYRIIFAIPVVLVHLLTTYAICSIVLNLGVYIDDLAHLISVLLRLMFYLSGIIYDITTRVPEPYNKIMLYGNPVALFVSGMRRCILYEKKPSFKGLLIWAVVSAIVAVIGTKIITKHENSYVKII